MIAAALIPTDEEERTRSIKLKLRFTVLHFHDRILCITTVIIIFPHHQDVLHSFLVLKNFPTNRKKNRIITCRQRRTTEHTYDKNNINLQRVSFTWNLFLPAHRLYSSEGSAAHPFFPPTTNLYPSQQHKNPPKNNHHHCINPRNPIWVLRRRRRKKKSKAHKEK